MEPISVGGFDDKVIRIGHVLRIPDDGLVRVSHVAAENYFLGSLAFPHPDLYAGGAQQMADVGETDVDRIVHRDSLAVAAGMEEGHKAMHVLRGVEGFHNLIPGSCGLAVAPFRF